MITKFNTPSASIEVILFQNGNEYNRKTVSAQTDDKDVFDFENVPKYDGNDDLYTYRVAEEGI